VELLRLDPGALLIHNGQEFDPDTELETALATRATAATQALFAHLFSLPASRAHNGAVVALPPMVLKLPRFKMVPAAKVETRWEKYARIKGIRKRKHSKWDWDIEKNEWRPRSGFQKANDANDQWVIEASGSRADDPEFNPFTEIKQAKKAHIEKQMAAQQANAANAVAVRAAAQRKRVAAAGGDPRGRNLGAVISLDAPREGGAYRSTKIAALDHVAQSAQSATASQGIFDDRLTRLGEKTARGKRKRFEQLIAPNSTDERDRYLKALRRVTQKDTDDAAVNVDAAVKLQKAKDRVTGRRTGEAAKKPRDTTRRKNQSRLPSKK
jgi:regulator of ribosome biosynthesis